MRIFVHFIPITLRLKAIVPHFQLNHTKMPVQQSAQAFGQSKRGVEK